MQRSRGEEGGGPGLRGIQGRNRDLMKLPGDPLHQLLEIGLWGDRVIDDPDPTPSLLSDQPPRQQQRGSREWTALGNRGKKAKATPEPGSCQRMIDIAPGVASIQDLPSDAFCVSKPTLSLQRNLIYSSPRHPANSLRVVWGTTEAELRLGGIAQMGEDSVGIDKRGDATGEGDDLGLPLGDGHLLAVVQLRVQGAGREGTVQGGKGHSHAEESRS